MTKVRGLLLFVLLLLPAPGAAPEAGRGDAARLRDARAAWTSAPPARPSRKPVPAVAPALRPRPGTGPSAETGPGPDATADPPAAPVADPRREPARPAAAPPSLRSRCRHPAGGPRSPPAC
jgi:hypothetical protein